MHVLITNDDGMDAPGLEALYQAVRPLAEISVIAPSRERSTQGHAVTLGHPIGVEQVEHSVFGPALAVDGSPADCVRLAIAGLLVERPIDYVVSGINRGANIGVDTIYSGTVAAAREAAILGVRAAAVSQYVVKDRSVNWGLATALTRELLAQLFTRTGPRPPFWNINLPASESGRRPQQIRTAGLALEPLPVDYSGPADAAAAKREYGYVGVYAERPAPQNSDVAVVFGGGVAVTPMTFDATDAAALQVSFCLGNGA